MSSGEFLEGWWYGGEQERERMCSMRKKEGKWRRKEEGETSMVVCICNLHT